MIKKLNSKGFILFETIYSIAIFGILSIAMINMFTTIINTYSMSKEQFSATIMAQSYFEKIKANSMEIESEATFKEADFTILVQVEEVDEYKGRLSKVIIEVMNGAKTIERIEGYKLIDLKEQDCEKNSS